jgi:murein L,D-transpeptidase YafK
MKRLLPLLLGLLAAAVTTGAAAESAVAHSIVQNDVDGGARSLEPAGTVLRSYRVALGLVPEGSKERAGDFRTPEGNYRLTRRNVHSDYFLSIQVSYPNADDMKRARRNRWQAGGSIMVHGLPNSLRHAPDYYATADWTDGCIALSNADMVEFWLLSRDNMPIDITP